MQQVTIQTCVDPHVVEDNTAIVVRCINYYNNKK